MQPGPPSSGEGAVLSGTVFPRCLDHFIYVVMGQDFLEKQKLVHIKEKESILENKPILYFCTVYPRSLDHFTWYKLLYRMHQDFLERYETNCSYNSERQHIRKQATANTIFSVLCVQEWTKTSWAYNRVREKQRQLSI